MSWYIHEASTQPSKMPEKTKRTTKEGVEELPSMTRNSFQDCVGPQDRGYDRHKERTKKIMKGFAHYPLHCKSKEHLLAVLSTNVAFH